MLHGLGATPSNSPMIITGSLSEFCVLGKGTTLNRFDVVRETVSMQLPVVIDIFHVIVANIIGEELGSLSQQDGLRTMFGIFTVYSIYTYCVKTPSDSFLYAR